MLDFKPITLEMLREFKKQPFPNDLRLCDYTPGCMALWSSSFNMRGCIRDCVLFCLSDPEPETVPYSCYYTMPVCDEDGFDAALDIIAADAAESGRPLRFCCVPEEYIDRIKQHFGQPVEISCNPTWSDYLYPYENFCGYKGKALHGQRNHVNRFTREHPDYQFVPMANENISLARRFMVENRSEFDKDEASAEAELANLNCIFDAFDALGLYGGLLFADNRLQGFTIGEPIGDTLHIHVEKSLTGFIGAYQVLAMCFAESMKSDRLIYINRQDDAGDEGLRKSKQGYKPCKMLDKYNIIYS